MSEAASHERRLGRRRLLGMAGTGAVGFGLGTGGVAAFSGREDASPAPTCPRVPTAARAAVEPTGGHQPGIAEPPTACAQLLALDLEPARRSPAGRDAVAGLLEQWTVLIDELAAGRHAAATVGDPASGLAPASLTTTVGFGPALLPALGMHERQPEALVELPAFEGDRLDPARCGGDVVLQVCAEDPVVVAAATRALLEPTAGVLRLRWTVRGFQAAQAARRDPRATPRNLMGQLDGTNNPEPGSGLFDATVWVSRHEGPQWMVEGSYLVVRRIRMLLDRWYRQPPAHREATVGRYLDSGAPIGARREHDTPDLSLRGPDGEHLIADDAHIRLASPSRNNGLRIHRRPFNYDDGLDANGHRDAGLLFLAWQADPRRGFVPIQQSLAGHDALNEYIRHEGSAVFAVPPAAPPGGYLAQPLFEG